MIKPNTLADLCYEQNSIDELKLALLQPADMTDMREWKIDEEAYYNQIKIALEEKLKTVNTDRYTYSLKGKVNYNESDSEEGFATVEIDELIIVDEMLAENAKNKFFSLNTQYDDFFRIETLDVETYGKKCAIFIDQTDESRTLEIDLIE